MFTAADDVIALFKSYSAILIDWGLAGQLETYVVDEVAEICDLNRPVRCCVALHLLWKMRWSSASVQVTSSQLFLDCTE